jgi:hypothetical protein
LLSSSAKTFEMGPKPSPHADRQALAQVGDNGASQEMRDRPSGSWRRIADDR